VRSQTHLDAIGWTARILKQVFALLLVVLIVPMGTGNLFAQSDQTPQQQQQQPGPPGPPPPPPTQQELQGQPPQQDQEGPPPQEGQYPEQGAPEGAPQGQPLGPEQLDQMVAPIALYPDALVAQILAASTYPSQIVEADRWVQAQGNVPAEQLAAAANQQNWDPSVKALVAFPSVLAQMDKNIQWTTDLGNAYYNQPDDVMSAVQGMRSRAQAAGTLHNTQQQVVSEDDGAIVIAPANPEVVYVPVYNPWGVYGAPFGVFPGYYYGPPVGVYFGAGLAIGFGVGIGIGIFSHWGWGYHNWGFNWRNRAVVYNHNHYYTRSRTVINHGFNRPGGPHGYTGARGAYNRGGNRGGAYNRGGNYNRGGAANRGGAYNRGAANHGAYNRGGQQNRGARTQGNNRGGNQGHSNAKPSGGHPSGGHGGGGGHEGGNHGGGGHPH
jgi:hypothetical protein